MTLAPARGFVLWRRERGEADLVLELLLDDGSFHRAIAPSGVRSSRRYAGGLSAFTLYRFTFGRARGAGFVRIDEAVVERAWPALLTDLRRTAAAGVVCAIARDLVRDGAVDEALFARVASAMEALSNADIVTAGGVLVWFGMASMARSGEGIVLDTCVRCGRSAPDGASVQLSPRAGGVVCAACGGGVTTLRAAERRAWRRVAGGDVSAFDPAMLQWLLGMLEERLPRASEVLRGAVGYWEPRT